MAFSILIESPGDFSKVQSQLSKDQALKMISCYEAVSAQLGWTIVAGDSRSAGKFKVPREFIDEFGEDQGKARVKQALTKFKISTSAFVGFGNGSTGVERQL